MEQKVEVPLVQEMNPAELGSLAQASSVRKLGTGWGLERRVSGW